MTLNPCSSEIMLHETSALMLRRHRCYDSSRFYHLASDICDLRNKYASPASLVRCRCLIHESTWLQYKPNLAMPWSKCIWMQPLCFGVCKVLMFSTECLLVTQYGVIYFNLRCLRQLFCYLNQHIINNVPWHSSVVTKKREIPILSINKIRLKVTHFNFCRLSRVADEIQSTT